MRWRGVLPWTRFNVWRKAKQLPQPRPMLRGGCCIIIVSFLLDILLLRRWRFADGYAGSLIPTNACDEPFVMECIGCQPLIDP